MDEELMAEVAPEQNIVSKKKKSTKKSLAAEKEQRLKFLTTLLKCDDLPLSVKNVLKQEDEVMGSMMTLSVSEMGDLWQDLEAFVIKTTKELMDSQDVQEVVGALVALLRFTALLHNTSFIHNTFFTQMVTLLNLVLVDPNLDCHQLKNEICELCELCCINGITKVDGKFYINTFNFLFDLTLAEKKDDKNSIAKAKAEIIRLWEMHIPLSRVNLQVPSCEQLVNKLMRIVANTTFLTWKEGRQFIAFTFTLDLKLLKKFHQVVKDCLPKCRHNQAVHYGEVYYTAWVNSSNNVRQALETHCIQNLMTHMFTFPRKKQELSHLGQNVFAILSYLHSHRTNAHYSKTLTNLYMPLIWRHLRSGNNIERCNAAQVFLDVYPLEKPGAGRVEESEFLNKQHSEMVDLLTDNCHVVRIIAIKGICNKLCSTWRTFPQEAVQVLMRNLLALANDGSDANVRRTLYDSLPALLHNEESAAYLSRILPTLRDYIHDESEKVRRAFVKMLCYVRDSEKTNIKFWKIVPMDHLTARLKLEGPEVGCVLSKLIMNNLYNKDLPVEKFLFRLTKFIETSPIAARKLFQYSCKILTYKDAVRVMLLLLLNLRAYYKRSAECQQEAETKRVESLNKTKRKRKSKEPLQTIHENYQSQSEVSSDNKENDSCTSNKTDQESVRQPLEDEYGYTNPGVTHAMVDIISILWVMHSQELMDPGNEEDHNNLLTTTCSLIPILLKYYKGEPTYYAVVHLASLVPASKLLPSTTVCSACVSHLRQLSEVTPQAELEVIVFALCSWNRFTDIQDIVVDWLDQAFRCEGFNQSQTHDEDYKKRKVRFVAKGGKPMLALQLLDAVFSHPISSKKVLEKSYNHVHELYIYLERIKLVIERRLQAGLPLDSPMLSDEFLNRCLFRYAKLILLLHRPEPDNGDPFDASEVFEQFIEWCQRVVIPMIPQALDDGLDISVDVLKTVLITTANLVDLDIPSSRTTVIRLAEFIKSLLTSECSVWYVEPSLIVIKHLKDFSEAMYGAEDQGSLMRTVLPSLLSQALKALSEEKYTKEQMADCIKNVYEVKTAIFEIVQCLLRMYGQHSQLLHSVIKLFTDALVAVIVHDIKQLQILETVEKVSELPWVCGLLIPVVCKPAIASLWLTSIPDSINQLYIQDANVLAAAVSLLHTLVRAELPLPKPELTEAVRAAHKAVIGYSRESVQSANESSSTFNNEPIDVKKVAIPVLSDLADFMNFSLNN